jgi:uncharacterized protein
MITLETIARNAGDAGSADMKPRGLPPVHLWNPAYCGDIDMRIASDGSWHYCGSPISRPAMVRLFSTILRRDLDRYVLVTPVEMVGIVVEDAPFLAVEMLVEQGPEGQSLRFRTNVDDWTTASATHPIRFETEATGGLKPYVLVRNALWAKVSRSVYLELVGLAQIQPVQGVAFLGIVSHGAFFAMAPVTEIGDLL